MKELTEQQLNSIQPNLEKALEARKESPEDLDRMLDSIFPPEKPNPSSPAR